MAGFFRVCAVLAALVVSLNGGIVSAADLENTLYMDVPAGRVTIELRPDLAPHTVARIKELVRQHFYDGIVFHRVIDGFMAQTGDPTGTGMGGSGTKLKAEFTDTPFVRGTLGMARAQSPDSGDSQFFICFEPSSFPRRQIHRVRPGDGGHGSDRRAQKGRPERQRQGQQPRQDHQVASRRRR